MKDAILHDAGFETALTHGGDAVEPAVALIAGFEAWLDDEIAVAEIGAAAACERIAYLFAQDQEPVILDVDATAIVRFEQQANIRVSDVVAVYEDPVASVGQDLAVESRALEGSSGGGGDEAGAVRSDADRD